MNIEPIPDIKNFPQIYDAFQNKKLVTFVGAGISSLWGCDRWEDLSNQIIDDFFEEDVFDYRTAELLKETFSKNPRKLLTITKNKNSALYKKKIRERLVVNQSKKNKLPNLFDNLRRMGNIFVTTNIDECFTEKFRLEEILWGNKIDDSKIEENRLFQLHGNFQSEDSWIMTLDEYIRHYRSPNIKRFLEKIFGGDYYIIFLGYGINELEIIDYTISKFDENRKSRISRNFFVLQPYFRSDQSMYELEQLYFDDIKTHIIPYAIDSFGYKQIDEIIREWMTFVNNEQKNPFMDDLKFIEENL